MTTEFIAGEARESRSTGQSVRALIGRVSPAFDFLLIGGASAILLLVLAGFVPDQKTVGVAAVAVFLAHFINNPHFAHSYQILYAGFGTKAFGSYYDPTMRLRYLWAAIGVPICLIGFFIYGGLTGDARLLGYGANALFFLVGWHYVKQGYGVLMVMSVLKKAFFDNAEKRILLVNAYAVWGFAWIHANQAIARRDFWGLSYYTFDLPAALKSLALNVVIITTLFVIFILVKRVMERKPITYNGLVGYVCALYLWTMFVGINPIYAAFIPAFHSLQYLLIVWRYDLNKSTELEGSTEPENGHSTGGWVAARFLYNVALAMFLGYLGFWLLPDVLNGTIDFDSGLFGATLMFFFFRIFINVHHYFIDNVIWRKQNPDMARYLFRPTS